LIIEIFLLFFHNQQILCTQHIYILVNDDKTYMRKKCLKLTFSALYVTHKGLNMCILFSRSLNLNLLFQNKGERWRWERKKKNMKNYIMYIQQQQTGSFWTYCYYMPVRIQEWILCEFDRSIKLQICVKDLLFFLLSHLSFLALS
jgi:hypothetical protein